MTNATLDAAGLRAVALVADAAVLERNLAALRRSSRHTVELIRGAEALDAEFLATEDRTPGGGPALTARLPGDNAPLLLASRRRPLDEAERLAETVPIESAACVVVMGFGLGHHVGAIARRMRRTGVVLVYEPDVPLLRAVLERIDHSDWLGRTNVALLTDPDDTGVLNATISGAEGVLAMGVRFVDHPPSLRRLADRGASRFRERFREALVAVQNVIKTTLVQSGATVRNLLMNVEHVVARPGIGDLAGCLVGRPAIVVSAGPSLRRNIDLLARPGVRERFAIIAVQTVLKTLLAKGIRPHFVTALDHHEISRRFYEGLSAEDVAGVTLVAEAKANPAILDSFPGEIRVCGDDFLTELLGTELAGRSARLPPGATVAHMAYYLGRHMGCDPVILIGQDLGFTDGQYYAAGAAIHEVWGCELNPFNTVETMEWERIARARSILRRTTDVHGRAIYTDEQMATYLAQFERDFLLDSERGLSIIDATEGGVTKAHTRAVPLADAIAACGPATDMSLPAPSPRSAEARRDTISRSAQRMEQVRRELCQYERLSRETVGWLEEMRDNQRDQSRVNTLIEKVHRARREVAAIPTGPRLVERLNQVGVFNRLKADRRLELSPELTPMERQRRQIERDVANVGWIADTTAELGSMIDETIRVLRGAPKSTRTPTPSESEPAEGAGGGIRVAKACRVAALVAVDPRRSGLGTPRDLAAPFLCGLNPLRLMLTRLSRCRGLDQIVLLAEDEAEARALVGDAPGASRMQFVRVDPAALRERSGAIRGARLWAGACWRGGLGPGTIFDEAVRPRAMAEAASRLGVDAAVVLGPDWALVDPGLVDRVIERHRESPARHRLTFSQAAPGLGPCVIERGLLNEFAGAAETGGSFASIGGLLGYIPCQARLRPDPIAGPTCVPVSPAIRDVQARLIPDSGPRREMLIGALAALGERALEAGAEEIARLVAEFQASEPAPRELLLEVCTGRRTSRIRAAWRPGLAEMVERPPMTRDAARALLSEFGAARSDAAVTFAGAGDPILHPELSDLVRWARDRGVAGVHVRTDLVCSRDRLDALIDAAPDVISVDVMGDSAATYRSMMGADLFEVVRTNMEHLLSRRTALDGLPLPWVVARITRCDGVYEEIESFYDRWLALTGAAVIDPLPAQIPGQRIEPLPVPAGAARRAWEGRMLVLCDARVPAGEHDLAGESPVADALRDGVAGAWRKLVRHRRRVFHEQGSGHADLWTGV